VRLLTLTHALLTLTFVLPATWVQTLHTGSYDADLPKEPKVGACETVMCHGETALFHEADAP